MFLHELIAAVNESDMAVEEQTEVIEILKKRQKKFRVVWQIQLEQTIDAETDEEANCIIENVDCQHLGSYVQDSFEIVKTEKCKE